MYEMIRDILQWLQGRSDRDSELVRAGLDSLNAALYATKRYTELGSAAGGADRATELGLAELWAKAATDLREAHNDLAVRLNDKARFWSDNERWDNAKIVEKRIELASLEDAVAELIRVRG